MNESFPYIDIILLAMFAGFIALRLRSVLGRRTGSERPPSEDVQKRYSDESPDSTVNRNDVAMDDDMPQADYRLVVDPSTAAAREIESISAADRGFDMEQFAAGARGAYDLILNAFWNNELDEIRPFVSDPVYKDFATAAEGLASDGSSFDNTLERVRKIELDDARLDDQRAEITLRFISDVRLVTKDREGRVIAGNPVDETEAIDVWTFERDLVSRDPNWVLVATASEAAE
ncbi:MAG: Tim44/TimA family putative adaptor protein [Sphingomonadales bacterium]